MNKILVVADFIERTPLAIQQALEFAPVFHARLHIVHFCYVDLKKEEPGSDGIREQVINSVKSQADRLLAETIDAAAGDGLNTRVEYHHEVIWSKHIDRWVNDYVSAENPCLVVKTGHRSESAFYTPTDWRLLRECPAPVLIAAEQQWRKTRNILAAVDLQSANQDKRALNLKILDQARQLATAFDVEMHIAYTPSAPPVLKELGIKDPVEVERDAKLDLQEEVKELARNYQIPEDHIHIRAGLAENVIPVIAAENKVSLVVMGTIGRTGIAGKLIGNTAEKVLSLLKSDVLALKP